MTQYSALTMIKSYEYLSNAEFVKILLHTPQSTNDTVNRLKQSGFISRFPDKK
ncbi:MAG: MarR family transcriptional regulator [Alphaproteobacteria bacterium]|nr:MarR family transcriptional regulator [Alphaproteobacteria bacterium]